MGTYARYSGFAATGTAGTGTVTSVGLADGSTSAIYTITGSPVTTAGTLTFSLKTKSANTVFAGPTTGAAAQPAFRSLVAADLPFSVGNITDVGTDGITITGGTGAIIGSGVSVAQHVADSTHNGYLSSTDWSTFNNKQAALTIGNLTDAGTDGITVTGGTGAVIGTGTSIAQRVADTTHNGYLSSTDWNTFNGKQSALTIGNLTDAGTDGITVTGGTGSVIGSGTSIAQHVADATHNGYLSSTDWNTFNGKGDVVGPAGAHDGGLVLFDSTTGKLIKESTITQHNVITSGANGTLSSVAPSTAGKVLVSDGTDWTSSLPPTSSFVAPTVQKFTSTGSTAGYRFTVTSANATVGATYTNNGNTYTVLATIAGATTLYCSQASAPQASGTLTRASGSGDATITFSAAVAYATYTLPTSPRSPLYIRVRQVGGGGGGGGSGTASTNDGTDGGNSTFGAALLVSNGGKGGKAVSASLAGTGGTASLGSGPIGTAITGGTGQGGNFTGANSYAGGQGGATPFGGPGVSNGNLDGTAAIANSGSGGGGAGTTTTSGAAGSGCGGGASGFVDAVIFSPASTYPYVVGSNGSGGPAGTSGKAGGNGAAGYIEVTEYYQ